MPFSRGNVSKLRKERTHTGGMSLRSDNLPVKKPVPKAPVRQIDQVSSDEESADEVPRCFQFHSNSIKAAPRPIKVVVCSSSRNGGRYRGILSESVYQRHLKNVDLQPARIQLQTYTNERLTILGKCHVTLSYRLHTDYSTKGRNPRCSKEL